MSVSVTLNGLTYTLPTEDETQWGNSLTSFLQALPTAIDDGGAELSDTAPVAVGTATAGVSEEAARSDHVHAHGNLAGGAFHAAATNATAGFASAAHITALEAATADIAALEAASSGWNLAQKPITPHAYDDEFEGSLSAWAIGGSQVATEIDPYAGFTTATEWRYSLNSKRPSWLMVQPAATGAYIDILHKAITIPTDLLVWARVTFNRRNAAVAANDCSIGFGLCASSAGAPDGTNKVAIYFNEADASDIAAQYNVANGGADTVVEYGFGSGAGTAMVDAAYMALQKLGSNVHFWIAGAGGNWLYLGTVAYSGATMDRVFITAANATNTGPGNMILGLDFIRFSATSKLLP